MWTNTNLTLLVSLRVEPMSSLYIAPTLNTFFFTVKTGIHSTEIELFTSLCKEE